MRFTFAIVLVLALGPGMGSNPLPAQGGPPPLDLGSLVQPVADENIFNDPEYFNWGSSIIRGEDGRYHLFYARWPRKLNFTSWLTRSEIAHAVADHPAGPYAFVETVLQGRGGDHWDAINAHNPKIKHFEGKYYLYYIATNTGKELRTDEEIQETGVAGYEHPDWMLLRNNQRTGVAMAESLDGPWVRMESPIVEPAGPIETLTVNPAVTRGPDSLYHMIVKGDRPGAGYFVRNQAIAVAETPTGPFRILEDPVIGDLDTEDASLWYSDTDRKYYAIFHAKGFIGLMESADGTEWRKAANYVVNEKKLALQDGSILAPDRMERPFVYVEDGQLSVLSFAIRDGNDAYCIFVPLANGD